MGKHNLGYFLHEGVSNMFSHGFMSFASIGITVACLLIMGTFTLVAVNANELLAGLEQENEILAFVDESYSRNEALGVQRELEALPNVVSTTYVSKAQAMDNFADKYADDPLFQNLDPEILRDRYVVKIESLERQSQTVAQLRQVPGIADVSAYEEIASGFIAIRNIASVVCIALIAILFIVSVFIISNTVRIATFTRREEIAVLRMCGASNWFIRGPFLVEGVILGLTGGIIAYVAQWGIYRLIQNSMENSGILDIISAVPFSNMALVILAVFLGVGFSIGAGGSAIAIGKFLKI